MGERQVRWQRRRRVRRTHGLQLPLHPQQVIAWVVMGSFIAFTFGAIVPALHSSLILPVSVTMGILFFLHICTHILALLIDPADPQLRKANKKQQIPEFDRNVHSHVIENGRCHLCNIMITSHRTKHCSACNKCVDVFDHHCKWLNHCIGKRNYHIFIACLTTAIISCILIMGLCVAEIALYYFDRENLAPWEKKEYHISQSLKEEEQTSILCTTGSPYCHFFVFGVSVYDGAFIGILSALFSVALVAEVLLIHLAAFHVYINYLNLTTYEYIRGNNMRDSTSAYSFNTYSREANINPEEAVCGWTVVKRSSINQITPSSTTETALLSTPSYESSLGSRSPRSASASASASASPSTSNDFHFNFSSASVAHDNRNRTTRVAKDNQYENDCSKLAFNSPISLKSSNLPFLPQVRKTSGKIHPNMHLTNEKYDLKDDSADDEIEVRIVSIPRPRPSRRRLKSSVAPHLSPIKECDFASASPPSLKRVHSNFENIENCQNNLFLSARLIVDSNSTPGSDIDIVQKSEGEINAASSSSTVLKYRTSPKMQNTVVKDSPLKATPLHRICNQPAKVFVMNDFKYNSPIKVHPTVPNVNISSNSKQTFIPVKSPNKGISPVSNSPRLMAHIKGKNVAITIVNEFDFEDPQIKTIIGREKIASKKLHICHHEDEPRSEPERLALFSDSSNRKLVKQTAKTTQNGDANIELHM